MNMTALYIDVLPEENGKLANINLDDGNQKPINL